MQQFVQESKVITLPTAKLHRKKPAQSDKKSEDGQFQSPLFQKLLPQLQQFCSGNQTIAILVGPKSSGKSTLLDLFQAYRSNIHYLHHCQGKFSTIQLLEDETKGNSQEKSIFQQIMARVNHCNEEQVLLIDDADLICVEEFQTMLDFFSSQKGSALKIILAGDDILLQRVQKLIEKNCALLEYMTLRLTPLSLEEMKDYLHQVFAQSRKKKKLLSNKNLERIYQLSKGYPGRINRVAAQLEAEFSGVTTAPRLKRKKLWYVDLFILLSIILLLCSVTLQIFKQANQQHATAIAPAVHPHKLHPMPVKQPAVNHENVSSFIASIENLPEEHLTVNGVQSSLQLPEPEILGHSQ